MSSPTFKSCIHGGCEALAGLRADSKANRQLNQCEQHFLRAYGKVMDKLRAAAAVQVDHRQTYFVLMCLNRAGLPGELGRSVVSCVA